MPSEAQKKASMKYLAKFEEMKIRVPEGNRERYKQHAAKLGKSLNSLIIDLLEADIQKHNEE